MFTYFYVFNDYGLPPPTLFRLALEPGYYPKESDIYSPNDPNFGNTNWGHHTYGRELSWDFSYDNKVDIRLFYTRRTVESWSQCRWDPTDENVPRFWRVSHITDR